MGRRPRARNGLLALGFCRDGPYHKNRGSRALQYNAGGRRAGTAAERGARVELAAASPVHRRVWPL
jgi:hypothetical protein